MFCGSAPVENCIEPDFTECGSHEWGRKMTPLERNEVLFTPARFQYLNSSAKDPLVARNDPEWPLAAYWPVYISNFMVTNWLGQSNSMKQWYAQVSDFFACKGFQTRMIYFHTLDTDYLQVLKLNSLVEALVYFGSEEEAERAIAFCHRCQYLGHWINVFPGRTPEYFCNERAVRLIRGSCPVSESFLETTLNPFGKVELISRHAEGNIVAQFKTKEDMLKALTSQITWNPVQLNGLVRIQRFIESEVKNGIKWAMETQEGFMEQRPRRRILQYFEDGIHPIVENTWASLDLPKPSKAMKHEKQTKKSKLHLLSKKRRLKLDFQKYMKTQEYKRMSADEKKALSEEIFKTHGFNPSEPKQPQGQGKSLTPKQRQASVLKSVNWLLKQNGKPILTKAEHLERSKQRDKAIQMARDQYKKQ